ncbi:hypothetical protein ACFFMR_25280 [Micromonospora andamanensis]|uniref:DUF3618 domain-containing protein n=1 Tax=Micromonospora andamanensis TaxID=1287068 RepID=A0ABQ4HWF7_9ACTN|nr:hypothetical protein [Micromonospora andamanensis]GIJ09990.1 hypothetical protein Van01_32040 [Micromonospora andamanensis]
MSGLLAQVVAQLTSAIDQLDALAVRASRAATDVAEAHARYTAAGQGSDHRSLRSAVTHSRTGADKAHRLARLSSDAARQIGAYLNVIAPGSVPQQAAASGTPSGEDLLADSDRRALKRAKMSGYLVRSVRRADDVQEHTSTATDTMQQSISMFRDPKGPSGTHSTGTATPTAPSTSPRAKIDAPEAAGNLAVLAVLAGVAAHRIGTVIRQRIVRFRNRGR